MLLVTEGQGRDYYKSVISVPVGSPGVSPLSLLPHWGAEEEVDNHNEGDKLSLGYFILFFKECIELYYS